MIVAAEGRNGHGCVPGDYTMRGTPDECIRCAVAAHREHQADRVIGESDNGGGFLEALLRAVDGSIATRKSPPSGARPSEPTQSAPLRAGPHPPRRHLRRIRRRALHVDPRRPAVAEPPRRVRVDVLRAARPVRQRPCRPIRSRDLRQPGLRLLVLHRSRRRSHPDPLSPLRYPRPGTGRRWRESGRQQQKPYRSRRARTRSSPPPSPCRRARPDARPVTRMAPLTLSYVRGAGHK
jgi:hypothetical protein